MNKYLYIFPPKILKSFSYRVTLDQFIPDVVLRKKGKGKLVERIKFSNEYFNNATSDNTFCITQLRMIGEKN